MLGSQPDVTSRPHRERDACRRRRVPAWLGAAAIAALLAAGPIGAQPETEPSRDGLQARFAEGQAAILENRYADAVSALTRAVELGPDIAEIHASLGFSYFQLGRFLEASPVLERAVALKPGMPNMALLLAATRSELGRFAEAAPVLEEEFPGVSDPALKRLAGLQLQRAYSGLGRDREAVGVALELSALYSQDPEVLYHASRLLGHLAFVTVSELSRTAPDSVWTRQAAGEAFESEGSHERAVAEYRRALEIHPGQRGIQYRLGRALLRGPQKADTAELAARAFQAELEADPTNANAAYELGEMFRQAGELERARELFEQAVGAYPSFEQARIALGGVLTSLGRADQALGHLRAAIALNDRNEVSFYRLAQAHRALGQSAEMRAALGHYQRLRAPQTAGMAAGVSNEPVTAQRAE